MAVAFPGKEILIGETGWPSQGRMREGALPSRTNQARVVSEILDLAKREGFRVNLIEAYDQPWKRQLEGTVGGYWGLFDDAQPRREVSAGDRHQQFPVVEAADGHAAWSLSVFIFARGAADAAAAAMDAAAVRPGLRLRSPRHRPAFCSGVAADKMFYESYGVGGWLQWGALLAAGIASPLLCANALMSGGSLPTFLELLGPREAGPRSILTHSAGRGAAGHHADRCGNRARLHLRSALPRFPVCRADHGGGAVRVPDAAQPPAAGARPIAESVFAGLLAVCALYIGFNEGTRKLAVAVDLRDVSPVCDYAVAGAGRAKPRISRPIAIPDSAIL